MKNLTKSKVRFTTYATLCKEASQNASFHYQRAKARRQKYIDQNRYNAANNIQSRITIPPAPVWSQFLSSAFKTLYRECNVVAALTDDMIISNLMLDVTIQHENATAGVYYNSLSNYTMD